jgi:hypothetical protein
VVLPMRLLHPVVRSQRLRVEAFMLSVGQPPGFALLLCESAAVSIEWLGRAQPGNHPHPDHSDETISSQSLGSAVRAEGGDPGLIDSDNAAPVMGAALQRLKDAQGEDAAKAAWDATGLQLSAFLFAVTPSCNPPLCTGMPVSHRSGHARPACDRP